ncbi:MAG: hypothetical protein ABIN55_09820 [Aeromicrobium sp.]
MTVDVRPEQRSSDVPERPRQPLVELGSNGWLAIAAAASLAAGAIHATAIGAHSEHRQAAVIFTMTAVVQLAVGVSALMRSSPLILTLGAMANVGAILGWMLAKTVGLPFEGLDLAEPFQRADSLAAILAAFAVLAVAAHLRAFGTSRLIRHPALTGIVAVAVAALSVPGMLATSGHSHEGTDAHAHGNVAQPYDPDLPIDLSGTPGVTPKQQAAAENLIAVTLLRLPQFADSSKVDSMGFTSIGDGFSGFEHYLNVDYMADDNVLDPDHPESLVYDTTATPKKLVSAMFMMNPGDTLDDVPELGGRLTQWHVHDNLCFTNGKVTGLINPDRSCPAGSSKGAAVPMIHVWITPHRCGPFSALDGIAAGSVKKGEVTRCDHSHGSS